MARQTSATPKRPAKPATKTVPKVAAGAKRQDVAAALVRIFKRSGYDGASLADLSAATQLAKASLYHRFPGGKIDMGRAALAESGRQFTEKVMRPLQAKLPPRERLRAMRDGLADYYAGPQPTCLMNSMTLGSGREFFERDIAATLSAWQKLIEQALQDLNYSASQAQRVAEDIIMRVQGGLIVLRIRGDNDVKRAFANLLPDELQ